MGWASGFKAGSDVAQRAIDVYQKAQQEQELSDIKNARPEARDGYTAEQGQQLDNIARAVNPETGQPYYKVEAIPGSAEYRVTPNFDVGGQPGAASTMAPGRVTDYLGRRYEGELSPEQQERAQYRAMADVVAKQDPTAGARLRMAITQDERAGKEFEQNSTLRGLQINEAQRKESLQKEFDKTRDSMRDNVLKFQAAAESGNTDTFLEVAKAQGADVRKTVDSKTGRMTLTLYEDGKPVGSANSLTEAAAKLGPMYMKQQMEKFGPLFANNPTEFMQAILAPRKDAREERESVSKIDEQGAKADYYRAAGRYYDAGRGRESLSGKVNEYATLIVESGQINPQTNKPYTTEEAKRYAAGVILKDPNAKEVSNKDVLDFVEKNGDMASDVMDPKTGKPIPVRSLPLGEQRRIAVEFYTGRATGGMPDLPKGGLKRPESAAAKPTSALRRMDGQKFGVLTPQSMIDEAAAAGNPDAIRYKQLQEERSNTPLNTGLPY